jgi:DNA-binding MarR family transcriptional regulator
VIELGRLLERHLHHGLAAHDVTAGQLMVLTSIATTAKSSRADLARRLQITPQAVGGITSQLAGRGLISRTPAPPGLPIDLALTAEGLDLLDGALPVVQALAQDMLKFFKPNLAGALDGALRHIMVKLQKPSG